MRSLALGVLVLACAASAADLSGTWQFEMTGRNGQKRLVTYVFKTEGSHFTGTYANPNSASEVVNGTIAGNTITFDLRNEFADPDRQLTPYKGEWSGEELRVTPARTPLPNRPVITSIFKKVSNSTVFNPPPELARTHKPFPPFKRIAPNGLAKTPPMGWSSWNKFQGRIDDKTVREIADAMVASGMRDAGYVFVNIDDTWQGQRDKDGTIQSNIKFPNMKALADYVHSKGLKLGIYSGPGRRTCAGYEGSYGHEEQDARTFAAWGIDYLKYDWCSASGVYHRGEMAPAYQKMARALRATGRPVVYSLCQYGWLNVGEWGAAAGGNLWRTTGDINDRWQSMSDIGFNQNGREKFAGPGRWNDPDMLEIGNGGMTDTEYRTHMSLWCMLAAPLLAGNDVRTMTEATKAILCNREVIAIDQDRIGKQGYRVRQEGDLEVWKKPLWDGVAVALFNRGAETAKMTVKWSEVGFTRKNPRVRDLWARQDLQAPTEFTAQVPSHGVVLLRIR
jgi:alpha-galactosidase